MWVWEHALFDYNPKRPDSTKKDKTVEVITKADHDAALRAAKVEALREMKTALTSQSGTSAWDVVSYIEARIVDHIAKLDARAAQIEEGE